MSERIDWRELLLDAVVAGVTHSLSNRVTALASAAEELRVAPDDARELAELVANEARKCDALVRRIRPLSGSPREEPEALRLSDLLPDAVAICQEGRYRVSGEWRVEIEPDLPPVLCRHSELAELLTGLIVCTLHEASPRPSGVRIAASADDRSVTVCVTAEGTAEFDHGRGVDVYALRRDVAPLGGDVWLDLTHPAPGAVGLPRTVSFSLRLPTLAEARRRERGTRES